MPLLKPAAPLHNANQGGLFFCLLRMSQKHYSETALDVGRLLARLKNKGLIILDMEQAAHCLQTVGYHRLSSYFDLFKSQLSPEWSFKSSTSFEQIWNLYVFDRELRLIVIDALEKVEVAFRAAISDTMSLLYEPHWYLSGELFKDKRLHSELLRQITEICRHQKKDRHLKNYYNQYCHPDSPPSWIITEFLSFGTCLSAFQNLKKLSDKKAICKIFRYHPAAIESWMESLRYTRNLCAHHSRLWNMWFVITPKLHYLYGNKFNKEHTFYAQAIILERLLQVISPDSDWQKKLYQLFDRHSSIPIHKMGFIEDWRNDPFWIMQKDIIKVRSDIF